MTRIWVVTFGDTDGRGGTCSYPTAAFSSEEVAVEYTTKQDYPQSWYTVDEFWVQDSIFST